MKELPNNWSAYLLKQPESGMGFQIVKAALQDGKKFEVAIPESQIIGKVRGYSDVPFRPEEIVSLEVVPDWVLRRDAHTWWTSKS